MDLAQGGGTAHEGTGGLEFGELRFGQGFSRLPVACHPQQGGSVVAPVLHELAGQFHRVPFDVVDAGGLGTLHGGEHVLEAMAEFVEEGFHFLEGHQAGGFPHRWALVADQVGHRQHGGAVWLALANQAFIHPGAAPLAAGTAVRVEVEGG